MLITAFAWWRWFFFHRNPPRTPPPGNELLCPADGLLLYREDVALSAGAENAYHRRVSEAFQVDGRWTVVATYLSIFDVHVVRAPCAGKVRLIPIAPIGQNLSMGASYFAAALRRPLPIGQRGYLDKNEFLGVAFEHEPRVLLVLMADWWIDQIDCWVKDGDVVERGQPLAKIHMGSQVDLFVPEGSVALQRTVGDKVKAALSVL